MFIVVETRIDARPKILDARVSCFELRVSIRASTPSNENVLRQLEFIVVETRIDARR